MGNPSDNWADYDAIYNERFTRAAENMKAAVHDLAEDFKQKLFELTQVETNWLEKVRRCLYDALHPPKLTPKSQLRLYFASRPIEAALQDLATFCACEIFSDSEQRIHRIRVDTKESPPYINFPFMAYLKCIFVHHDTKELLASSGSCTVVFDESATAASIKQCAPFAESASSVTMVPVGRKYILSYASGTWKAMPVSGEISPLESDPFWAAAKEINLDVRVCRFPPFASRLPESAV